MTTNVGYQLLLAVLVVLTAGLLVRELLANDRSALDIVLRAAALACWLTLLAAGVIGRRRQRRGRDQVSRGAVGQ
ncbi:hypothetical protein [Modestobacter italicus]|uniref:hypothetical protein n=1 Tax=Modestobacter italicus (strain DSM 44449 / CECT 9708 / BC 501) TaxID=2732864 RepID=UPI001412C411|nr:hypothetical protein [Modestobacter marinus]